MNKNNNMTNIINENSNTEEENIIYHIPLNINDIQISETNINNNDLNDFLFHQDGILSTENNRILKIRFDKSKNLLM